MGVSGVGKTTLARDLAAAIGGHFLEADIYHPPENVRSMEAGIPLTDDMRVHWLDALADAVTAMRAVGQVPVVLACSALKRQYRDRLSRAMGPDPVIVHLHGTPALIHDRLTARQGHFMPAALLDSQLRDLEPPTAGRGDACRNRHRRGSGKGPVPGDVRLPGCCCPCR